jgi:hypothetical protein
VPALLDTMFCKQYLHYQYVQNLLAESPVLEREGQRWLCHTVSRFAVFLMLFSEGNSMEVVARTKSPVPHVADCVWWKGLVFCIGKPTRLVNMCERKSTLYVTFAKLSVKAYQGLLATHPATRLTNGRVLHLHCVWSRGSATNLSPGGGTPNLLIPLPLYPF